MVEETNVWKFWFALIFGTIIISGGLTYLKLHRGAQTIDFPAPAEKPKLPLVEFQPVSQQDSKNKMEISANVVTINVPESTLNQDTSVSFNVLNKGAADLELSMLAKSCTCADVFIDDQRISGTTHLTKIAPGKTALIKLTYKLKQEQVPAKAGEKVRLKTIFHCNDERYVDNLHFEIVTTVKTTS